MYHVFQKQKEFTKAFEYTLRNVTSEMIKETDLLTKWNNQYTKFYNVNRHVRYREKRMMKVWLGYLFFSFPVHHLFCLSMFDCAPDTHILKGWKFNYSLMINIFTLFSEFFSGWRRRHCPIQSISGSNSPMKSDDGMIYRHKMKPLQY